MTGEMTKAPVPGRDIKSVDLPHDCPEMRRSIESGELGLIYEDNLCEYGLRYRDGGTSYHVLSCCPFDGATLPASLRSEWFGELEALGLDLVDDVLPAHLLTDEWWRRRNRPGT